MALTDIFAMVKADRYTQDGREEIIKAQETEVEDRTYNIGEISQKTGLMKTANGWVEPPKGKAKGAKTGAGKANNIGATKIDTSANQKKLDELTKKKAPFEERNKVAEQIKAADEYNYLAGILKERGEKPNEEMQKKLDKLKIKAEAGAGKSPKNAEKHHGEGSESKPSAPKAPKPTVQEYMKAKDEVKKFEETYKKQKEDYDYTQRVKANGGDISMMFPYNVKPKELSENPDYMKAKDIISRMEANDAAPRVLTGDCKIRVRKGS